MGSAGRKIAIPGDVRSVFGELLTVEPTPIVQLTAQYDVAGRVEEIDSGSGTTDHGGTQFVCTTGTTAGSRAEIRSNRGSVYRAGQGIRARFTARFPLPGVADCELTAGLRNPTDAIVVGYYNGSEFGILHRHSEILEIRSLTIDNNTGGAETVTVELDGASYPLSIGAGSVAENARDIVAALKLTAAVDAWIFEACGAVVTAMAAQSDGPRTGAYSIGSTGTLTGTWVRTTAGVLHAPDFIPQSAWNLDTRPDLDPTKINVFEIHIQYLGGGALTVTVEDNLTGGFVPVHRIRWANLNETTTFTQAAFRIGWLASSSGSVTDLSVAGASASIYNEGPLIHTGSADGHDEEAEIPTHATNFYSALVVRAREALGGRPNLTITSFVAASVSSGSARAGRIRILKNPTLPSTILYTPVDPGSAIEIGGVGDVVTGGKNVLPRGISAGTTEVLDLETLNEVLLAGDVLVIAINVTSGAATDFVSTLNWREDF